MCPANPVTESPRVTPAVRWYSAARRLGLPMPVAALFLITLATGCATTPARVQLHPLPPGTPAPKDILRDLADNQDALHNFSAKIEFLLESPQVTGKNSGLGTLYYRQPASLVARAVHFPSGVKVLELTVNGAEYLLWLPQDNAAYHSVEGVEFQSVPFRVSPGDIVQEMFNPEDWGGLRRDEARVEAHDEIIQTTTLLIGPAGQPRRRIEVVGPPWNLARNELLNEDEEIRAVTLYADYVVDEHTGIRYPTRVEAHFPSEDTMLRFDIRRFFPNTTLDQGIFDIQEQLRDSRLQRHLVHE